MKNHVSSFKIVMDIDYFLLFSFNLKILFGAASYKSNIFIKYNKQLVVVVNM